VAWSELGSKEQRSVVERLAALGGTDADIPLLAGALRSSERYVRLGAVRALGRIGTVRAADLLQANLPDADPPIVAHSVVELMRLEDKRAVPVVQRMLTERGDDADDPVREGSLVAFLVRFADRSSTDLLAARLNDAAAKVRRLAPIGLGRIGSADARSALEVAAGDLGWWRGRWARKALRRLGG